MILAAVDFSDGCQRVVDTATALAKAQQSALTLIHVAPADPEFVGYEVGPSTERQGVAEHLRSEHQRLQLLAEQASGAVIACKGLLVAGAASAKILEHADKLDAEVIVIGSHGHGALYHLIVGSVVEGVLKEATRPVLVVPVRGEADV